MMREQEWVLVGFAFAAGFFAARLAKAQARSAIHDGADSHRSGGRYDSDSGNSYAMRPQRRASYGSGDVEEAIDESFPASDPPSFNPGITGGPPRRR